MRTPLVVGAQDLAEKEALVLRSLIRLLDGQCDAALRFSERVEECNVVFVPEQWSRWLPKQCVIVRVLEDLDRVAAGQRGLTMGLPLRTGNVLCVLQTAAELVAVDADDGLDGLPALFRELTEHLRARERRITTLPLDGGRRLIVDFIGETVLTDVSLQDLLEGSYQLAESRRTELVERDSLKDAVPLKLRDLVWQSAHRLGVGATPGTPFGGRYRLLRWPDATALARPGVPRLVALLTSRPASVQEAAEFTGMTVESIRWFLAAALAFGVATPVEEGAVVDAPPREGAEASPRSILGRLRDRLKPR